MYTWEIGKNEQCLEVAWASAVNIILTWRQKKGECMHVGVSVLGGNQEKQDKQV